MNRERDEDSEKVELQAKNNIISKWALIQLKWLLTEWMDGWMDGWPRNVRCSLVTCVGLICLLI